MRASSSTRNDENCTVLNKVGGTSASSPSGTLSASSLTEGEHRFYFTVTDSSSTTHSCSKSFLAYILDVTAPGTPTIAMASGASGTDTTPEVTVSNLTSGDLARVYSDNTCGTEAGAAVRAEGGSARITVSEISGAGSYTFYAKAVDLAGNESPCSATPATYEYTPGL